MSAERWPVRCACGTARGEYDVLPAAGARGVCYCDDCQAYGRFLGGAVLNARGGTEVIQSWPAQLRLTAGRDEVRLLRLSPKGLHRWYAGCCRTPIANGFGSARSPFLGVMRVVLAVPDAELTAALGPGHGVQGKFAPGGCPEGVHPSASAGIIGKAAAMLFRGWWRGGHSPSPFFGAHGALLQAPQVLTTEERAALR